VSILIVDDEEIILQTLSVVLRRKGLTPVVESDPVRAVKNYEHRPHNVALVDVLMPGMNGVEVVRRVKRMNPLCNVIVMTAFSNMEHVVECIEAGAVDYVTKPFTDLGVVTGIVLAAQERVERWSRSFGIDVVAGQVRPFKRVSDRGRRTARGQQATGDAGHGDPPGATHER
jgi:CheY-like chemotaxis protein